MAHPSVLDLPRKSPSTPARSPGWSVAEDDEPVVAEGGHPGTPAILPTDMAARRWGDDPSGEVWTTGAPGWSRGVHRRRGWVDPPGSRPSATIDPHRVGDLRPSSPARSRVRCGRSRIAPFVTPVKEREVDPKCPSPARRSSVPDTTGVGLDPRMTRSVPAKLR